MPHIKSYLRTNGTLAAFYLLTSANVSKAAWGSINKGNAALRIMSYEAGVMFLPKFVVSSLLFMVAWYFMYKFGYLFPFFGEMA